MTLLTKLTLTLLVTQILDWYSTRTVILNGTGQEGFTVSKWFLKYLQVDVYLALKAAAVTGAGYVIGTYSMELLMADVAWYGLVLINNAMLMATGKGLFERIVAKIKG